MEEEDKDETLKAEEKPSVIHTPTPTPKPRPVPRPRNLAKGATTVQNGKPGKMSPKPVILPKPRRPPPNAPFAKPVIPDDEAKNVTNNNEVAIDKKPLGKPLTETINTSLSFTNLTSSRESINNVETSCSENGPTNVNSIDDDDEWYEPLRRNTETVSSNSEDDYEHVTTTDKSKDSQAMIPRSVNKTFKIRMKLELITF